MIEDLRSIQSIAKVKAHKATLACELCVPAHGIHFPHLNSALRVLQARMGIAPVSSQRASNNLVNSQDTPCIRPLSTINQHAQSTRRSPNQDLHASISNAHNSRIMHLCMLVENPRMVRDTSNHLQLLKESDSCTAIRSNDQLHSFPVRSIIADNNHGVGRQPQSNQ